jgi:hypothetical protein
MPGIDRRALLERAAGPLLPRLVEQVLQRQWRNSMLSRGDESKLGEQKPLHFVTRRSHYEELRKIERLGQWFFLHEDSGFMQSTI